MFVVRRKKEVYLPVIIHSWVIHRVLIKVIYQGIHEQQVKGSQSPVVSVREVIHRVWFQVVFSSNKGTENREVLVYSGNV